MIALHDDVALSWRRTMIPSLPSSRHLLALIARRSMIRTACRSSPRFRRFLASLSKATASRLLRSGAVYIGGAIGMEMIGSFAVRSNMIRLHSLWYGGITGLEEALELFGIILLIDTLLRELLAQRSIFDLTLRLRTGSEEI